MNTNMNNNPIDRKNHITGFNFPPILKYNALYNADTEINSAKSLPPYGQIASPKNIAFDCETFDKPAEEIETLLVVDDEKVIVDLCKLYLEELGYKILTATMPEDAISLVESYNKKIDLLITDIMMPVMNGLELAETISSLRPGIKCVFISGCMPDKVFTPEMLKKNINFIRKPFRLKDFAEKIRNVLAG